MHVSLLLLIYFLLRTGANDLKKYLILSASGVMW